MPIPAHSTILVDGANVPMFGWVPPAARTTEETTANNVLAATMPQFRIEGSFKGDKDQAFLFKARQQVSGDPNPAYINQTTGSCVGAGGGNMLLTLRDVEIALGGEAEGPEMFWWLYAYGYGRKFSGMGSRGEGSTGTGQAKAMTEMGTFLSSEPGLPAYTMKQGWYWLAPSTEREWSIGGIDPAKWDPLAKLHLIKTAAVCRSASDAATALLNGYPLTVASMMGTTGQKRAGGDTYPVMLSEWDGSWSHQMFVDAYWKHPVLGEIFRIGNNWGPDAHSNPVDGSPRGGFWVRAATLDRMAKGNELIAFSAFQGFPARELDWKSIL